MTEPATGSNDDFLKLIAAIERMASARSFDAVIAILRETARAVVGADGIAVVLREGDQCFYAVEDACEPLWAGQRFPAKNCISGWAMAHGETVAISDVAVDSRIPQAAYRTTFVRSAVVVPIGHPDAIAAVGAYWSDVKSHDPGTILRLEALARAAAVAIENGRLITSLEKSEAERKIALEAGRMGVWTLDIATGAFETSAACRVNFGRPVDIDFSYEDLRAAVHPDHQVRVAAAISQCLGTGAEYDIEYRIVTPSGEPRWVGVKGKPFFDEGGQPVSMSGVCIDVTERKGLEGDLRDFATELELRVVARTRELEDAQSALRQSQKLEAMGQLTGGVAHDFNNLLAPIVGSLDLLKRREVGNERERRLVEGALQAAERATVLVQRLLAFARRQPLSPTAVDLTALLLDLSPLIDTTVGPRIAFRLDHSDDVAAARVDPNQIEMAVLNLAVNARDAMVGGGTLTIATCNEILQEGNAAELPPGAYVCLRIRDTGTGMDETTRRRAIEPFFSTKGIGQGTGLGLSMVHGLAAQLGGAMTIESELRVGTDIRLWLPACAAAPATVESNADTVPPNATGRVLLVDDEDLVRASTADMLEELGFDVLQARSGEEALALLGASSHVDVLVTDHLMPSMTGPALAKAARVVWPSLPILVVSGYSNDGLAPPEYPTLEKPFKQADLARSLAVLCNSGRATAAKAPGPSQRRSPRQR